MYTDCFEISIPDELKVTLHTDSESLISRCHYLHNRLVPKPSYFTLPDQDLLLALEEVTRSLPRIHMQHVKSHQDKNIPFDELSLPAQLNFRADELATQALELQRNTPALC